MLFKCLCPFLKFAAKLALPQPTSTPCLPARQDFSRSNQMGLKFTCTSRVMNSFIGWKTSRVTQWLRIGNGLYMDGAMSPDGCCLPVYVWVKTTRQRKGCSLDNCPMQLSAILLSGSLSRPMVAPRNQVRQQQWSRHPAQSGRAPAILRSRVPHCAEHW